MSINANQCPLIRSNFVWGRSLKSGIWAVTNRNTKPTAGQMEELTSNETKEDNEGIDVLDESTREHGEERDRRTQENQCSKAEYIRHCTDDWTCGRWSWGQQVASELLKKERPIASEKVTHPKWGWSQQWVSCQEIFSWWSNQSLIGGRKWGPQKRRRVRRRKTCI